MAGQEDKPSPPTGGAQPAPSSSQASSATNQPGTQANKSAGQTGSGTASGSAQQAPTPVTTAATSQNAPPSQPVRPPVARPQAAQSGNPGRPPNPNLVRPPQARPPQTGQTARPPSASSIAPRPGQSLQPRPGMARPVQPHAQGRPPHAAQRPSMQSQARPGPLQGPNGTPGRMLTVNTASTQQGNRPPGLRPGQSSVPGSAPSSAPGSAPNSAPGTPRSSVGSSASGGAGQQQGQGQGGPQPPMRRPPGSISVRPLGGQMTPNTAGSGISVGGGLATPTTQGECEAWASRLRDTSIAAELRDSADHNRDANAYITYFGVMVPAITSLLKDGSPAVTFIKDSEEQKFRSTCLAILQRLPRNDALKPHEGALMSTALHLLKVENEENALLCIKIIIDGFRSHKEQTEQYVQPFLDLVKQMYANTKSVVEKEFGKSGAGSPGAAGTDDAGKSAEAMQGVEPTPPQQPIQNQPQPSQAQGQASSTPNSTTAATPASGTKPAQTPAQAQNTQQPQLLPHALHSPKVLTECPIAVVLIFQSFKTVMENAMKDFYPLVMESIAIQPEPQRLAYVAAKEKGMIFTGVAEGIKNREMYTEVIKAQVKTMAFLAYVSRGSGNIIRQYLDIFPEACVRLLRDCPPEDVATRKELLIATRHMLSSEFRTAFVPFIDLLLNEKVLVGAGVTSKESLRPLAYSTLADLIHQVRNELSQQQLARVISVYASISHDPTFPLSIQTMCGKLIHTCLDSVCSKSEASEAVKLLNGLMLTSVEKLKGIYRAFDRMKEAAAQEKSSGGQGVEDQAGRTGYDELDWRSIERVTPIVTVAYANDNLDIFLRDAKVLLRSIFTTIRSLFNNLRNFKAQIAHGEVLHDLFRYGVLSLRIYEGSRDAREEKDALELLSGILLAYDPHTFTEVWTYSLEFYCQQVLEYPHIVTLLQSMLSNVEVSHQTVAILLKHLMDNLESVGSQTKAQASLSLRLFKCAFMAVNSYIDVNEQVLVPHLAKLIINCFTFAAKAEDPSTYYQILRALFRSIGGGRFEALYKEVLPILEEMLETLNHLLTHSEPSKRDLFVELCLTVPVRLTNLLPHLGYLMKPLVYALNAGTDLVNQGLRTLELCIDNLTAEFLDPTMAPVLRDLMNALYNLLKPVPFDHLHSHAAVKILGKLGGRNRRFQQMPYLLEYQPSGEEVYAKLQVDGSDREFEISRWINIALGQIQNPLEANRGPAVDMLKQCSLLFMTEAFHAVDQEPVFVSVIKGLLEACQIPEHREDVVRHIRKLSNEVFAMDIKNRRKKSPHSKRISLLSSSVVTGLVQGVADGVVYDRLKTKELFTQIIDDFIGLKDKLQEEPGTSAKEAGLPILMALFSRFAALCYEEGWSRKLAGCLGLQVLADQEPLQAKWIPDRQLEYVRALFFVLRDVPKDTPRTLPEVVDLLKVVIKMGNSPTENSEKADPRLEARFRKLVDLLVHELPSQQRIVRETTKECIQILADLKQISVHDLIEVPAKERLLNETSGPIFNKPLRALPFGMQIGNVDAITYLLSVKPIVPAENDELLRLFHETIALADADDASLIGRVTHHGLEVSLRNLRVACLRLLCAGMESTQLFTGQNGPLRSKIISVYFKHMYSPSPEIVEVAHEGLRSVLAIQTKLPKDILQTGLRPILVNLADARRLSVSGLEGLARFLELLTNYFKVEIGVKLLDHFRSLADPTMLANAAVKPYEDNQDIARMVRLVNVFRLLPSAANTFLKDLTLLVADAESKLHQSQPGPFTTNLALYFNKYPVDAVNFLLESISNADIVRTYLCVIRSQKAPRFAEEFSKQVERLTTTCLAGDDINDEVLHGVQLINELSQNSDKWLEEQRPTLLAIIKVWRNLVRRAHLTQQSNPYQIYDRLPGLLIGMFMRYLDNSIDVDKRLTVDLLFQLVEAFDMYAVLDKAEISNFIYSKVTTCNDIDLKRDIFAHALGVYSSQTHSLLCKINTFRYVVNPMLWIHYARLAPPNADKTVEDGNKSSPPTKPLGDKPEDVAIIRPQTASVMSSNIWVPFLQRQQRKEPTNDSLTIEIVHMTSILVEFASNIVGTVRKDIIKVAWGCMGSTDPTVKSMAYLLAGRFFTVYESPENLVRKTWNGLLRVKESEARSIYRQATDVLARSLPKRDPAPATGHAHWAMATKRFLVEEGGTTPQLVTVCELLVSNPDLFYNSRDLFVAMMANSLTKLGFVPAATADMKKLTIDIVELIFRWERRRLTGVTASNQMKAANEDSKKRAAPETQTANKKQRVDAAGNANTPTSNSPANAGGWSLPIHVRELITSYLVRLVSTSQEPISRGGLTARALTLLREILGPDGLPGVTAKLTFFQRTMLSEVTDANYVIVSNSAEVISIVCSGKDKMWITGHLAVLSKLLESAVLSDYVPLHDILRPILEKMFECLPKVDEEEAPGPEISTFQQWAENIVGSLNKADKPLGARDRLQGPLFVLQCYVRARPDKLELMNVSITKLITRLARECTSNSINTPAYENALRSVLSILGLCKPRLAELKDQRRNYLSAISHLIENSGSAQLCRYILDMLREWILERKDNVPSAREKAGLLQKLTTWETRGDDVSKLYNDYLTLLLDIFEDDSLDRSDLTNRLEGPFLLGTRCADAKLRHRFVDMLEQSLPYDILGRLRYILVGQNWEHVKGTYWMALATDLLIGCIQANQPSSGVMEIEEKKEGEASEPSLQLDTKVMLTSLRRLLHLDHAAADAIWPKFFRECWVTLPRPQQINVQRWTLGLLTKEYHMEQLEQKPNIVQTLLRGVLACGHTFLLPPFVVKYLGKTFNAWHIAIEIVQRDMELVETDELRDACADALTELYAELGEEDLFYGLWRRRCLHEETNAGIALEQNGLWPRAQEMYELAQSRVKAGIIPYTENECALWQDHWILAATKLQQWDILTDLARHEGNHDLLLECAWRLSDWGSTDREMIERTLDAVSDIATPRRKVFEAYTALIKAHTGQEKPADFLRVLDEAVQLTIRKWVSLPSQLSSAHAPLLQLFQQFVELQEAAGVFESLTLTNQQNLETRVTQDLKPIFQTWRERLPNFWDDISVWSDLLAWRQHVFSAVTKVYVPLIPSGETATYGFRGYHETAWMINRFGHVARKHQLSEVCTTALSKIYALPNIEISEAFLKLREQAMCFYQRPEKFADGLDSISTTNLMYFAPPQKAEFLTLKGMFLAKLGNNEDSNLAFAQAVQMDLNLPKAWAEWGKYNDRLFREKPIRAPEQPEPEPGKARLPDQEWIQQYQHARMNHAANAVSCYMQAAGLYKSAKARKLLIRVLWLLGLDDASHAISRAFEMYRGDHAIWYWITLIPQLLLSLSHREARQARNVLVKIAKSFPQALFYQLRTHKEDFILNQRQMAHAQAKRAQELERIKRQKAVQDQAANPSPELSGKSIEENANPTESQGSQALSQGTPTIKIEQAETKSEAPPDVQQQPEETSRGLGGQNGGEKQVSEVPDVPDEKGPAESGTQGEQSKSSDGQAADATATEDKKPAEQQAQPAGSQPSVPPNFQLPRQPQEYVDDTLNILKTAFPLLALSMEKMVDHINVRSRAPPEEDVYRFLSALLTDAMSQWAQKTRIPNDDEPLPRNIREKIHVSLANIRHDLKLQQIMHENFLAHQITFREYIRRMQRLHDRYEQGLDNRPRKEALDIGDCLLSDFHHTKFDEVEIPGQYIEHVDSNNDFVKIGRFSSILELARGFGFCFRRITIIGHNGSNHTFAIQSPSGRHCRREERLAQLFRIMNSLRLVVNDSSYLTLQDVFDDHCKRHNMLRDVPMLHFIDQFRKIYYPTQDPKADQETPEYKVARMELVEEIAEKFVPENVLTNYMIRTLNDASSLWLMRKHFALQTAASMFLSHVACLSNRTPGRFHFSLKTGLMYMSEVLPCKTSVRFPVVDFVLTRFVF
ncbi:hypothetical protein QFC19_003288 [Naganishia cerealis]|uniref:Uncharacterized protein n=1 Tax=Naganishia cerealis TaxID=610337 RepID=A0ACC2W2J0_9TREE|nr:hypothetical protein QFC19_003288 [Naganishia cerealis]